MMILDVRFLYDTSASHEGIVQRICFCLEFGSYLKLWLRPDLDKVSQRGEALKCSFGPRGCPRPPNEGESRFARCLWLPHSLERNYSSFWCGDALRFVEGQCSSQFERCADTLQELARFTPDFAARNRKPCLWQPWQQAWPRIPWEMDYHKIRQGALIHTSREHLTIR